MHHSSKEIQQPRPFIGWLRFQRQTLGRLFRDETLAGFAVMIPALVGVSVLLISGLYWIHPAAGLIAGWPCVVATAMLWAVQVGALLVEQETERPSELAQGSDATNNPTTSKVINNRP